MVHYTYSLIIKTTPFTQYNKNKFQKYILIYTYFLISLSYADTIVCSQLPFNIIKFFQVENYNKHTLNANY